MKFFICYSRHIQIQARDVIDSMRDGGSDVWWDQDIRAGQDWWSTILDNIEACKVFIFMISEQSVKSPYCMEELRYALSRNRLILPYVMGELEPNYSIPSEIMKGRIQYEVYNGRASTLRQRIKVTCQAIDWKQYKDRYAARPGEPNTGLKNLADRLDRAITEANIGRFEEAIKGFNDVLRSDYASYGEFCDMWLERINRYEDVANLAQRPTINQLARQKWDEYLKHYNNEDIFDPLGLGSKLAKVRLQEEPIPPPPPSYTSLPMRPFPSAYKSLSSSPPIGFHGYYRGPGLINQVNAGFKRTQGLIYTSSKQYTLAIESYTRSIQLDPSVAEAYLKRGNCYVAIGKLGYAIADYSEAIHLNPKLVLAYKYRAVAYRENRDYDQAIVDATKVIHHEPKNPIAYAERGYLYLAKKDYVQAIIDLDIAVGLNPQHVNSYVNRGKSHFAMGNLDQAIRDHSEALRLNPKLAEGYSNRAMVYLEKRDYDQAIADLTNLILLEPMNIIAYNDRGVAYEAKEDYDSAIKDYDRALAIYPNYQLASKNRERILETRGRQD